ncbi:hypothetical protein IFM89_009729 [Coptis chinensis]|uniref:DUF7788 domain-containing protein n=1 Tax=Coptis chinensis TaxID=261450 RepID=A0A835LR09_9MAGN|nr:hypothetical protein IFM89_009729 [Coptis chinensis]
MEFDQASANDWETDYKVVQRMFQENGFASVPEIVFWNLQDWSPAITKEWQWIVDFPTVQLVKVFLENDGVVNPVDIMEKAIADPEHEKLVVVV